MGWFVRDPVLRTGETVEWQRRAARQTSAFIAGGGRLLLTSTRLIHDPNRMLFGRPWSTERANISGVTIEPRGPLVVLLPGLPQGRLRNRLRVELADNSVQLFLVRNFDLVLPDLRSRLANDPWRQTTTPEPVAFGHPTSSDSRNDPTCVIAI